MYKEMLRVSERTIERFSLYRRRLIIESENKEFIYSHELAELSNSTADQVRRDLMHLGCSGAPRIGYNIKNLIECIDKFLDPNKTERAVIAGVGNLGRSLLKYFKKENLKISVISCVDIDEESVGKEILGVPCFHFNDLGLIIKDQHITIGIIASNENAAKEISRIMAESGIKYIINFTNYPLNNSDLGNVFLEQIDITASFEKVAYLSKSNELLKI